MENSDQILRTSSLKILIQLFVRGSKIFTFKQTLLQNTILEHGSQSGVVLPCWEHLVMSGVIFGHYT